MFLHKYQINIDKLPQSLLQKYIKFHIKKTFEVIIFSLPDIGITKMYIISNIA
ncbi:hypothetical protein HMPREF2532_00680 [Bacteroides ovatus]|nr:hypothetical protein HMPREF2532_00680 [Bacteroides ovatus]